MRIATLLAVLTVFFGGFQVSPAQQYEPRLLLHRAQLSTAHADPALLSALRAAVPGLAVIQLRGPVKPTDRDALNGTGVELLEYLPEYAFLVRGNEPQLAAAARLPQVAARLPFTAADKLAPPILHQLLTGTPWDRPVRALPWSDDRGQLERALNTARIRAPSALLNPLTLAALAEVRWVEPASQPRLLNDIGRTIMGVDTVWQGHALRGSGQIIAIADSGLDTGDLATISPDFAGRIVATHIISSGGDLADQHGHGTHVAGSAAGAGVQSGANPATGQYSGSFAGIAPEAGLVIQAFEAGPGGEVIGLDPDYYGLFAQAYADGARIHSNSWGDPTGPISGTESYYGGYPFGSQRTDQFVWDYPQMLIFFAAGNSGKDGTPGALGFCTGGDGVVDPDSLVMPGTAKNVITVGASESQRASGGASAIPWLLLNFCFGISPINLDLPSNNSNGMAAFSSRGPTDDGRIKPDLVAPGTNIVSNRSHAPGAGTPFGVHETNSDYVYLMGTSMATPLAAGAGALARQWLGTQGLGSPSAAAIKAVLLNTTVDIAPGQYGTGSTQEIPSTRPNNVAGWGRVSLGFIERPAPFRLWVDDHTGGLATGTVVEYSSTSYPLFVTSGAEPLRVLLAWTDPPASLSATRQLVNDLDLTMIGPDGTIYYGNGNAAGDRINNVEGIVIPNPQPGAYTVRINAVNVPVNVQPYALSVAGNLQSGTDPVPPATPVGRGLLPLVVRP